MDTVLAECTLESMDGESGTVVPSSLATGRLVHFSTDNIDINDSTPNGKHTVHATQAAERPVEHHKAFSSRNTEGP